MSERRPNLPRLPCFMRSNLPTIPSPTTHRCPWVVVWFPDHRAYRRKSAVRAVCIYARRPWRLLGFAYLGRRLATTTGRIEFVILRTSCSPPVALHPASRRRSYFQLQGSDNALARTFTLQIRSTRKRTPQRPRAVRPRVRQARGQCRRVWAVECHAGLAAQRPPRPQCRPAALCWFEVSIDSAQ